MSPLVTISIGTDIVEISRVKQSFERYGDTFLDYVYSPAEKDLLEKKKPGSKKFWEFLSGRLAAKEALYKSLKVDISYGIKWKELEILNEIHGSPVVKLSGKALIRSQEISIQNFLISISHCREFALAYASAQGHASKQVQPAKSS